MAARRGLILALLALLGSAGPVWAQGRPSIPDDVAQDAIRMALENVHKAMCEDDRNCAPATALEIARPPITTDDARAAMVFGIRSAVTEWCGLDYQRSFRPMMRHARHNKGFNNRQAALLALIHGAVMERRLMKFADDRQTCNWTLKLKLDRQLPALEE